VYPSRYEEVFDIFFKTEENNVFVCFCFKKEHCCGLAMAYRKSIYLFIFLYKCSVGLTYLTEAATMLPNLTCIFLLLCGMLPSSD
jgi:hypothetical protein